MFLFYFMQRQIFEENLNSRLLSKLFSVDAEERLDKKKIVSKPCFFSIFFYFFIMHLNFLFFMFFYFFNVPYHFNTQILFGNFDPPYPAVPRNVGHFCVVGVNLKLERFELIDSLRDEDDPDAQRVFHTMVSRIKKLWRQARNSRGESFPPMSIDHFEMKYVRVAKQRTPAVLLTLIFICSIIDFSYVGYSLIFCFVFTHNADMIAVFSCYNICSHGTVRAM